MTISATGRLANATEPRHPAVPDAPGPTAALQVLLDQEQRLRDRLYRLLLALALTEELAADMWEQLADRGSGDADKRRRLAGHARTTARACRELSDPHDSADVRGAGS